MTAIERNLLGGRPAMYWDPRTPVHFDERFDTWNAFSHADVLRILNDREVFSSGYGWNDEDRQHVNPAMVGMWAADGQRHDDLRAAVSEPFRRTVLERLDTEVRRVARCGSSRS